MIGSLQLTVYSRTKKQQTHTVTEERWPVIHC